MGVLLAVQASGGGVPLANAGDVKPADHGMALAAGHLRFAQPEIGALLRPGEALEFPLPTAQAATAVGAITLLGASVNVADGTPVGRITVWDRDGGRHELLLRAGEHTAEWAWDRPDVAPVVRHRRAPIAENYDVGEVRGHKYVAELRLPERIEATRVRVQCLAPAGTLQLSRLALYDGVAHRWHALTPTHRLPDGGAHWARRVGLLVSAIAALLLLVVTAWIRRRDTARLAAARAAHQVAALVAGGLSFRRPALLWLALAAAPCCYFWRATLGQIVLGPGDALFYNFPIRLLAMGIVLAGHLPLWNPFGFSGSPLFGESASALLYPTTWLFAVLPPSAAANVVVLSAYSVAVIGTYAYARAMGCSRFGAAFGGLTFGFSGFMVAHIGHTGVIQGISCLPWFLLFLDRLRHRAALRYVAGAAGALALVVASGHPAIPMYVTITGGLYVAFFTWCVPPAVGRWRYLGLAAGSVAIAIGGCAIQLLPTFELMRQSVRAQLSFEAFVAYSLPLAQLPMLLFPYLFGGSPTTPYWGAWWGVWELTGYAGVAPLMLALASLRLLRANAAVRFWSAMALLALMVVLGDATPLARMLYHMPVYNLFRAPARVIYLFNFAVAVLSALALTRLEPAARRALGAGALAVLAASVTMAALAVLAGRQVWGALAAQAFPAGFDHEALRGALAIGNPDVAVPVAISAVAAAVLLALARQPSSWWKGCLLAVQLADLYLLGAWMPNVYPPADLPWQRPNYIQHLNDIEPDPAAFRLVLATSGAHETAPYAYALWGVPMVNGYDSLMLSRYGELTGMDYTGVIPDTLLARRSPFLDVLNGKYLLAVFPGRTKPFLRVGRIDFALQGLGADLQPGESTAFGLPRPKRTSQVGVVSYLGNSVAITDGTPVARLVLTGADGRRVERLLRAGADTADLAWDRPDVASAVRHRRAPVVHSFATPDGTGHAYGVALGDFEPFDVVAVEVEQLAPAGTFHLARLSLYNAATDRSTAVTALHGVLADRGRWIRRFGNGVVEVLENRDVLPRAWLVPSTTALSAAAVTRTVREGRFPDGRRFDPRATALVEDRLGREFGAPDPDATVHIIAYEPNVVELVTRARAPAMLVLSETFYPGWTATVDDAPVPVVRVDAMLRGVELPAGEHVVRFAYRPRSFVIGAAITGATLLVLLGLGVWRLRRYRGA